jgi:hypothetical protein
VKPDTPAHALREVYDPQPDAAHAASDIQGEEPNDPPMTKMDLLQAVAIVLGCFGCASLIAWGWVR